MKTTFSKLAVSFTFLLFTTTANAIIVNEYFVPSQFDYETDNIGYTVTNDTNTEVAAFVIGNPVINSSYPYAFYSAPAGEIDLGWQGMVLDANNWDSWGSFLVAPNDAGAVQTASLGSFASLFPNSSNAAIFSFGESGLSTIAAGATASGFTLVANILASPFIALDKFGNIIDQHDAVHSSPAVSAVPVPAAAWLFGSALLGFFGVSRSKKA